MTQHIYEVFGLKIAVPSTLQLSGVTPTAFEGTCDVTVRYAQVPVALDNTVAQRFEPLKSMQVMAGARGEVLWSAPFGRIIAREGTTVEIALTDIALERFALLGFVFSHCIPTVLIQRGILALHANAAVTPTGAVAIGGVSGAGKSTLLAGLVSRGMPMLSDDVTAIRRDGPGAAHVIPGFPHYRLCADALERVVQPAAAAVSPLGGVRNKFSVAIPAHSFHAELAALRAIYLLETYDGKSIQLQLLTGAAKLQALRAMSFTPLWFAHLPSQITLLAAIASAAPVFRIRRPKARWTLDELMGVVTGDAREQRIA
jgi:hypothetical protein